MNLMFLLQRRTLSPRHSQISCLQRNTSASPRLVCPGAREIPQRCKQDPHTSRVWVLRSIALPPTPPSLPPHTAFACFHFIYFLVNLPLQHNWKSFVLNSIEQLASGRLQKLSVKLMDRYLSIGEEASVLVRFLQDAHRAFILLRQTCRLAPLTAVCSGKRFQTARYCFFILLPVQRCKSALDCKTSP